MTPINGLMACNWCFISSWRCLAHQVKDTELVKKRTFFWRHYATWNYDKQSNRLVWTGTKKTSVHIRCKRTRVYNLPPYIYSVTTCFYTNKDPCWQKTPSADKELEMWLKALEKACEITDQGSQYNPGSLTSAGSLWWVSWLCCTSSPEPGTAPGPPSGVRWPCGRGSELRSSSSPASTSSPCSPRCWPWAGSSPSPSAASPSPPTPTERGQKTTSATTWKLFKGW